MTGNEEDNESEIAISSYGDFRISPEDFKGEGEYFT